MTVEVLGVLRVDEEVSVAYSGDNVKLRVKGIEEEVCGRDEVCVCVCVCVCVHVYVYMCEREREREIVKKQRQTQRDYVHVQLFLVIGHLTRLCPL